MAAATLPRKQSEIGKPTNFNTNATYRTGPSTTSLLKTSAKVILDRVCGRVSKTHRSSMPRLAKSCYDVTPLCLWGCPLTRVVPCKNSVNFLGFGSVFVKVQRQADEFTA